MTTQKINEIIEAIANDNCGIVTDDQGNGCAGPIYLGPETLHDMLSSDAFITASEQSFDEDRARYAFESLDVDFDDETKWVQVELQHNLGGWSQVGWIWA